MHISFCGKMLLAGACVIMTGPAAWGQRQQPTAAGEPALYEVSISYSVMQSNRAGGGTFWTQGGAVQAHRRLRRGLGLAIDVAGLNTPNENIHIHSTTASTTPVGLDLVSVTAGPRYTWNPARSCFSFFGQFLAGGAFGINSVFSGPNGTTSSASSIALLAGGGVNLRVSRRFSVRAIEADWLRTQMPNASAGVQNNLRLGAGLVWHVR